MNQYQYRHHGYHVEREEVGVADASSADSITTDLGSDVETDEADISNCRPFPDSATQ